MSANLRLRCKGTFFFLYMQDFCRKILFWLVISYLKGIYIPVDTMRCVFSCRGRRWSAEYC